MSLADQQWCPTSVQVTVLQARGLRIKGKSGTNDAYAVMQVGKEKFQTSVVEKSVAPVWKEEAAFDLPPLLHGAHGSERSTLHVHVLHRALVGPDKLLGQAVINLLQLSEDKTRSKTEWFKLLDKSGKPDKDRGEVLLDIQFMRNNMTASMFDLSAAGKSRSRLGKFKDKVRGKKKESDSGSNTLPPFTQVLTDSEDEANGGEVAASKDGKKKNKMKSLFSPKSNLQKNMSQSMSVLPGKNSTLSGSQSSGLNVDSSEGKKKFKFKIHKRSGSSDSKDPSSGLQKQLPAEQSNLCINGSHIYCEEPPTRTSRIGSNFSLASSGHGSMEEVPENSPPSVDSLRAVRQYSPWTEEEEEEEVENIKEDESRRMEDEEKVRRQQEELERLAEEDERRRVEEQKVKREEEERIRRQEEEERERLAEEKRRLEEQERKKIEEENEKRQREEEERIRMEEERAQEERRRRKEEEEERVRREEERKLAEEKRRLEEEERRRKEEEEERVRREEKERKLAEEKRRLEEEERKRVEEEERRRREEEERAEEEERVRKEKEEYERLMEEKRKLEDEKKRTEAEERRKRMEEERMRKEEEERKQREEEEMRRQEEEERVRKEREEYERLMEEKRRLEEEKERIEAEEKLRKEEEKRIRMEEEQMREEEKRRQEEEERMQREEEERIRKEELRRQEEEEKARKEKEEYERLMEEKRKVEDEKKRIEADEKIRREEEERVRMEEEMRRQEEEERVRKEKEEYERLVEEKRKLEEEKERIIAEEKLRREEEERIRMEEERRRNEEEEKRRQEEQERIRIEEEEERRREEEERARKEKEEYERLEEERRKEEEQRRRIEEEERIRKEEQERIKMEEEKKRQEEEERARKEKEEMERLAEERRRKEEEEKRRIEEEERMRRERKEQEEARRLEKEKRDAEEQKKTENKDGQKAAGKKSKLNSSAEVYSTNPFDENYSYNPFEEIPDSPPGAREETVQQRCHSSVSSLGSKIVPADEKELVSAQREKRPAPQPPGRSQAEKPSQREQDASARHPGQINTQNKDKDLKTVSVPPQRSVQAIVPVSRSPTDSKNGESLTTKGATGKHSKRPAPPRPRSVEDEPKTTSTAETKQTVYGLNPFEDDEDENNAGPACWPPAADKDAADKDAASQTKTKSSKVARAPPPPQNNGTLVTQNAEGGGVADDAVPDGAANKACDPQPEAVNLQESPVQNSVEACVKKEGPPVAARRLQPVKPLNSVEQQSVSVVQGENKSTGTHSEAQDKAKVNDSGLKGPFSQLTQEELISLVLKQENQLSERDKKISELEQYIDNLLVRVIEEQPSILMSMNSLKKAA